MLPSRTAKTAIDPGHTRPPSGPPTSGRPDFDVLVLPPTSMVVLTIEDADRKLEAMAHEALGVLGHMMQHAPDHALRVHTAGLVLQAWGRTQRSPR